MALFLLCPNLGWIQGQFNFTELSLRYHRNAIVTFWVTFGLCALRREKSLKKISEKS